MTNQVNNNSSFFANCATTSSGEGWNAGVSMIEGGHDSYMHLATIGYALDAEGNWQLSTASVGAGGHGSSDWDCQVEGDYWYLVGQTTVTGTFTDEADDHMTYSYTILASISDGAWALSGTGDNEAKGTAGTSYSV